MPKKRALIRNYEFTSRRPIPPHYTGPVPTYKEKRATKQTALKRDNDSESLSTIARSRKIFICCLKLFLLAFERDAVQRKNGKATRLRARPSPKMAKQIQHSITDPAEWFGDLHPLAAQLGSTDGLVSLGSVSALLDKGPVTSTASLRKFLRDYHTRILFPVELPAIESAHGHALGNETRELIELDRQMAGKSILRDFAPASRRVGQCQLQKLRPLRDQRVVQRYLKAVEEGTAHGWHTLVYGVTLAIYSLPLRQGLLGYAQQTTASFIFSAARPLRLSEKSCRKIFDELTLPFAGAVEKLLRKTAV